MGVNGGSSRETFLFRGLDLFLSYAEEDHGSSELLLRSPLQNASCGIADSPLMLLGRCCC